MHTQNCCAAKPPNLEASLYSVLVTANEEECKFFLVLFHNLVFYWTDRKKFLPWTFIILLLKMTLTDFIRPAITKFNSIFCYFLGFVALYFVNLYPIIWVFEP